jgi:hypothetical protein
MEIRYLMFETFIITLSDSEYSIRQIVVFFVLLQKYPDDDCKSDGHMLVINNV